MLTILPDTYLGGGQAASFDIVEREGDGELLIDVSVKDARALKAFFFHLEFDPQRFGVGRLDNPWLLGPESECLALFLSDPGAGVVEFGELLMLPQEPRADGTEKGFSGDGLLCTLHLRTGPAGQTRRPSAAPGSDGARAQLSYDADTQLLSWQHFSPGDYNQDGNVAVSDLTPIGIHFSKDVPAGSDPDGRDSSSIEDVVDGSNDGKVNVSDLTAIGLNFQDRTSAYNVYRGEPSDLPTSNRADNGPGAELVESVGFDQRQGNPGSERVRFERPLAAPDPAKVYWVRPNDAADGSGASGTPSSTLDASLLNQPPVAVLSGPFNPILQLPAMADFSTAQCADPDGTIVLFEFDSESDGVFEQSSAVNPGVFHHDYNEYGIYTALLRVTDNDGAQATASWEVDAPDPSNLAPVVDIQISASAGQAPLLVEFDLSGSSDPDGQVVLYEFNLDGEPGYEISSAEDALAQHTYLNGGSVYTYYRVTDNQGRRTVASGSITVEDAQNLLPIADLQVAQASGEAPLAVEFDASGSFDTDGQIVSYHWDFYGDGDVDIETVEPFVSWVYPTAGTYDASVTAVDNDAGESAPDAVELNVTGGWSFTIVKAAAYQNSDLRLVIVSDEGPSTKPLIIWEGTGDDIGDLFCVLGDATAGSWSSVSTIVSAGVQYWDAVGLDGLAAVAYGSGDSAIFRRSLDPAGTNWTAPVEIDSVQFGVVDSGISLDLVNGFPAVAYNSFNIAPLYSRAEDALGNNWAAPTLLQLDGDTAFPQLIGGTQHPVVLASIFANGTQENGDLLAYSPADNLGALWDKRVTIDTAYSQGFSGCSADGVAQICYSSSALLWNRRASDPEVSSWSAPQILANPPGTSVPVDPSMATIAGIPAVAYGVYPGQIWYTEATDATGETWKEPLMIYAGGSNLGLALAAWNNRPAIAFGSGSGGGIYFLHLP